MTAAPGYTKTTGRAAGAGLVGRSYLERGRPVVVVAQWRTGDGPTGPHNVRVRRADGTEVVRPFRGLRKVP